MTTNVNNNHNIQPKDVEQHNCKLSLLIRLAKRYLSIMTNKSRVFHNRYGGS